MLDISIKALDKAMTSKKKALDFIRKHVRALEKIDGTKLTLIRNDEPFDPKNYLKNWIIGYKGKVIYSTEFKGLEDRDEEIKTSSIGTSQYKLVHDHMRRVHSGTASIPPNTEFFVEFVQNKPTITRDYGSKGGMFLIGFGSTGFAETRGHVYSSASFQNNNAELENYRRILRMSAPPVVFEGNFSSPEEILKGCLGEGLKSLFLDSFGAVDFSDPQSIAGLVSSVFSRLQSSLGGQAEGVVLQIDGDDLSPGALYKVLAADQHSKEARAEKKGRFASESDEEESLYRGEVSKIANRVIRDIPPDTYENMFDELSSIVYRMQELPYHPVKDRLKIQDDIFLSAKMSILYSNTNSAEKIGIIPMAAKPFHRGHDALIAQSFSDGCSASIVFLSLGDRDDISAGDMMPLWRKIYLPALEGEYGGRLSVIFSGSPLLDAMSLAKNFAKHSGKEVAVYGGIDETGANEAQERVDLVTSKFPELEDKIKAVGVNRALTGGISGTQMRSFLSNGDKRSFVSNLPDWLTPEDRNTIWSSLFKGNPVTTESLIRSLVKEMLNYD
jgi:hypothetical protein